MKKFLYNPIYKEYKSPVGACEVLNNITINIKVDNSVYIDSLVMIIKDDNSDVFSRIKLNYTHHEDDYHNFNCTFKLHQTGIYWYYFEVDGGIYYLAAGDGLEIVKVNNHPVSWLLSVHDKFTGEFDWYKGKVMYQIFVDRFYKGGNNPPKKDVIMHKSWDEQVCYQPVQGQILNIDFFGGDLQGIICKLDYLKSLNVGVLYLNPIFEARSNHKYDTGDYMKIDSMFGTIDDFKLLIKKAAKRDIKIILDGVFNHTGDNSIYFNKYNHYESLGAYQSPNSPYYSWYRFIDYPHSYESWWGFTTLPAVNQEDEGFLNFITGNNGVIKKWLSLGAKGFRLDVVDELNDNFIDLIYQSVKEVDNENIVIGEVWEDASTKYAYSKRRTYFNGHQLDTVMNYPLKRAILSYIKNNDYTYLKYKMRRLINNYPKHALDLLMNHLGTHDTMRLLNNFATSHEDDLSKDQQANYVMRDKELARAIRDLKLATTLQFTLPGIPCIYYGDEIGMQGFRDPFCRGTFKWDKINQEVFDWYQQLTKIRSKYNCFKEGRYEEAYINDNIFSFYRHGDNYKILVIINNNEYNFIHKIDNGFDILANEMIISEVSVPKKSVKIIKVQ